MSIVHIKQSGKYGVIKDLDPHELPVNAWSDGGNVRCIENSVEKFQGHDNFTSGGPTVAPYSIFPVRHGTSYHYVYAGAADVYATDGGTETKISSATYAADADIRWTGGVVGNVLVLNNGVDGPAMWNPSTTATKLTSLTGWDANWTCDVMRVFQNFLLALNVVKSGTRYPQMVKWSHGGVANAVPTSWDETDPTLDAGESNGVLAATGDTVVDCLPLGSINVVYKEGSTYGMQRVATNSIFRFWTMFEESGILARRCAASFRQKHFVVTQEDVVVHDGQSLKTIADERVRDTLVNGIDPDNLNKCFVVPNYAKREIWFCYPKVGSTWPDAAWVWSWLYNTWYPRALPTVADIVYGRTDLGAGKTWGTLAGPWSAQTWRWNEVTFNPVARGLIMGSFADTRLYRADQGWQFESATYASYVERKGMHFDEHQNLKRWLRVRPYISGVGGQAVGVRVGGHERPDDDITWDVSATYTVGTDEWIDTEDMEPHRFCAIRFEDQAAAKWRLAQYDVDLILDGER